MSTIRIASLSLQGKRPSQQDRIFNSPVDVEFVRIVAAVADGLGGMQAGDKAAEIAVDTLKQASADILRQMSRDFRGASESLLETYERINVRIRDYSEAHGNLGLVGTTLTTLAVSDSRYVLVNAGDSRCYLIDETGARQMTRDHTVADMLLQQGVISPGDYESSPLRNQLTKSLGPRPDVDPDVFPPMDFGSLDRDCTFLLCSDGFYSTLRDTDMMKLLGAGGKLDEVLKHLAAAAIDRNTSDNLSAVAVQISI